MTQDNHPAYLPNTIFPLQLFQLIYCINLQYIVRTSSVRPEPF